MEAAASAEVLQYSSNADTLHTLLAPLGVFALLDEESRFPAATGVLTASICITLPPVSQSYAWPCVLLTARHHLSGQASLQRRQHELQHQRRAAPGLCHQPLRRLCTVQCRWCVLRPALSDSHRIFQTQLMARVAGDQPGLSVAQRHGAAARQPVHPGARDLLLCPDGHGYGALWLC